jgi:hypothetical protein
MRSAASTLGNFNFFEVLEDLDEDAVRVDDDLALFCDEVVVVLELILLAFAGWAAPPCWLVMLPSALRLVVIPWRLATAAASLFELPNCNINNVSEDTGLCELFVACTYRGGS